MTERSNAKYSYEFSVEGREFKSRSPQRKLGNKTRAKTRKWLKIISPDNLKKIKNRKIEKLSEHIFTFGNVVVASLMSDMMTCR